MEKARKRMIAIKDMEMPKYCIWDCHLAREDGGACQLADVRTSDKERPKDCPLVEVDTCEDAISRKSMLDYLKYLHGEMPEEEFVKALPSVTPIRPKGHWIDHSDEGFVECSNCGSATNCDGNIADLHFCFSCGAEMESKE